MRPVHWQGDLGLLSESRLSVKSELLLDELVFLRKRFLSQLFGMSFVGANEVLDEELDTVDLLFSWCCMLGLFCWEGTKGCELLEIRFCC